MKPRITLAWLLAVVACCGVGFAALVSPSQLWASTIFTLTLGVLTVAAINAISSRERTRAFWLGFLLCGGIYFGVVFGPGFRDQLGTKLVTTALLDLLYAQAEPLLNKSSAVLAELRAIEEEIKLAQSEKARAEDRLEWSNRMFELTYITHAQNLSDQYELKKSDFNLQQAEAKKRVLIANNPVLRNPDSMLNRTLKTARGSGPQTTTNPSASPTESTSRWAVWAEPEWESSARAQVGPIRLACPEPFSRIGHSLLTLLLAALAGLYARSRSGRTTGLTDAS